MIVTGMAVMIPRREADDIVSLNVKGPDLGQDLRVKNLVADHTTTLTKTALEGKRIVTRRPLHEIVGAEVGRRRFTGSVTPPKSSSISKVMLSDVTN